MFEAPLIMAFMTDAQPLEAPKAVWIASAHSVRMPWSLVPAPSLFWKARPTDQRSVPPNDPSMWIRLKEGIAAPFVMRLRRMVALRHASTLPTGNRELRGTLDGGWGGA